MSKARPATRVPLPSDKNVGNENFGFLIFFLATALIQASGHTMDTLTANR